MFVVEGVDADQAVTQGAQRLVVGVAGAVMLVVEAPGARAVGERAEGPLVDAH